MQRAAIAIVIGLFTTWLIAPGRTVVRRIHLGTTLSANGLCRWIRLGSHNLWHDSIRWVGRLSVLSKRDPALARDSIDRITRGFATSDTQ